MITKTMPLILGAVSLAACAAPENDAHIPASPHSPSACNADNAQSLIGERATADIGTRLMRMTGAQTLRWAPPRSALTLDYRHDRLTVGYDDDMLIDRIGCC